MDRQRFDELTKVLGKTTSRRQVLKGLAGATLGGLLTQIRSGEATANPKPDQCRPEGKKSKDPSRCCSGDTNTGVEGVCCANGIAGASCATSGCCGSPGDAPFCVNGTCVACLPEGAESVAAPLCCGDEVNADGVCCALGVIGDSCAASGCCGNHGDTICHESTCVACLPGETASDDPSDCCSQSTLNGICCGTHFLDSCATSGCCGDNLFCRDGRCVTCLGEGEAPTDPEDCCGNKANADGVCCALGVVGDSCAASGCCGDVLGAPICHEGTCVDCLPVGAPSDDPERCCLLASYQGVCVECYPEGAPTESHLDCCSETSSGLICCGDGGGSCADSGCCEPNFTCCNGICRAPCSTGQIRDPATCLCKSTICTFCEPGSIVGDPDSGLGWTTCNSQGCPSSSPCQNGVCVGNCVNEFGGVCPLGTLCGRDEVARKNVCCPPCECFVVDGACSATPPPGTPPSVTCTVCPSGCIISGQYCSSASSSPCCGSCVNGMCI